MGAEFMKKNGTMKKCIREGCSVFFYVPKNRILTAKYCSRHCMALHRKMLQFGIKQELQEPTSITWTDRLAYVIGIIATDGTLRKNRKTIKIGMVDKEVIEYIQEVLKEEVLGRKYNIFIDKKRDKENIFNLYTYQFTSPLFYKFCLNIGLMPNKSLILQELIIPKEFFSSFLSGVIDGDGNINVLRRKLKDGTNAEHLHVRIFSGSEDFLMWLNNEVSVNLGVEKGTIVKEEYCRKNPKFTLFWSNRKAVNKIISILYSNGYYVLNRKIGMAKSLID